MEYGWFKPRGYMHFDAPVGLRFAERVACANFVKKHAWLPLIHYTKRVKRYKPKDGRTIYKDREIMYASHRDACILSKYSADLTNALDEYYKQHGLGEHIIAYRKLGRSNYDFSADAYRFAIAHSPCVVLCYDIEHFFDSLDHGMLKNRLKRILGVEELTDDWYVVFRQVTSFRKIHRDDLERHPFGPRLKLRTREPLATIAQVTKAGIPISKNSKGIGIPQGTPISSAFSNLYMADLDKALADACRVCGALYQRYSDDILIACKLDDEDSLTRVLQSAVHEHRLQINKDKTERMAFDRNGSRAFQYLGFNISPAGVVIRPASLARQWRRAKRSIRLTKRIGAAAIANGKASKIYTRKLRKRFYPVGVRNFSSYARRSAGAFGSRKIVRQVLRLERMVDKAIRDIDTSSHAPD